MKVSYNGKELSPEEYDVDYIARTLTLLPKNPTDFYPFHSLKIVSPGFLSEPDDILEIKNDE